MAKKYTYSDLDTALYRHPTTDDVVLLYDFDAIKNAVLNILKFNRGEKLFNRNFGAHLRELLFEPLTPALALLVKQKIKEAIYKYEPRVIPEDVTITPNETMNEITINVLVRLKKFPDISSWVTLTLERVR
jgi:phage baseplate assembly protein W